MRVLALVGVTLALAVNAHMSRADDEPVSPVPTAAPPAPTAAPPPAATYAPPPPPPNYAPAPNYYYPPPGYYYGPPPRPKRTWYGWQTLASDGLAITLLYAAAQSSHGGDGRGLAYGSLLIYNIGAPTIHFGHGNYLLGGLSLAVRSLPTMLIVAEPRDDETLVLFTLLSIPAMIAIDASLGREEEETPSKGYALKVGPTAAATKNGGLVGLGGQF